MKTKEKSATTPRKVKAKEFDSQYIKAYLDCPALGKLAALRKTDHPNPTPQKAWDIHHRLRARINADFDLQISEGAPVGYKQTLKLATEADSETVQAGCAKTLMEWGDKAKPQRIQIEQVATPEEMDAEIAILTERISKANPKPETQH